MDREKIEALLETRKLADKELEKMRTAVTILFSDIKGSTSYFERKGDVEGLAMVQHHNDLLIPIIEREGGHVVKTIGDAIMARFEDPVWGIRAAIAMQRALEEDRDLQTQQGKAPDELIHIRAGLHTGLGLLKGNDVYGDVVNAAARVQTHAEPDQILITDVMIDAAKAAGAQCVSFGIAELKGKDETIEVYAVAWSSSAGEQLIEELQSQYDRKLKDAKKRNDDLEEEIESVRDQARNDRRRLTAEIEELEEAVEAAKVGGRKEASEDLHAQLKFQLEEANRAKQQAEQEVISMHAKFELERNSLRAQIASMQGSVLEAMERSNNPARMALAVREQVDARLKDAKQDWQLEWEGERRRLNAEIERLKKAGNVDDKKEAARRALLEKLGKAPAGSSATVTKTVALVEKELEDARIAWETERSQMNLKLLRLEREANRDKDSIRNDVFQELRGQYEPKLAEAERQRVRLQEQLDGTNVQLAEDRERLQARIEELEHAIPEAQDAARVQAIAEIKDDFDNKLEEVNRLKARNERRMQDSIDELDSAQRRYKKQIAQLEEQLKEAKDAAFRAQRSGRSNL